MYRIVLMILALLAFLFFFYETHHAARSPAPRNAPVRVPVQPPSR
jgi:hypothetical protein